MVEDTRMEENPFIVSSAPKRDDQLALIEDLEVGPVDHIPPIDDPNFEKLEPNSGIRLSCVTPCIHIRTTVLMSFVRSRAMSHEDLQDHLRGRYYLSPSRLYSSVRLLPDKQGYDVPVEGDWVTIAIVAERGPVKHSKAPVGIVAEDGEGGSSKEKKKHNEDALKPSGKKYINMKLVDFGSRSRSSATGGKAVIRGDALLSMIVFESEHFDFVTKESGAKAQKLYKGGSRGAFESILNVKVGDVIALLNPRILKPFQVCLLLFP